MTDEPKYEEVPDDVREMLQNMGMNETQIELCNIVGQKTRNFVVDAIGDNEMVSPADLFVASVACKMVSAFFEGAAYELAPPKEIADA